MMRQPEPPALVRLGRTLCVRVAQAIVVLFALALSLDVRAEPADNAPAPCFRGAPARPAAAYDRAIRPEQVIRSGWHLPMGFSLRLPAGMSLEGRPLVLAARVVLARRTLFELGEPRKLAPREMTRFVELTLLPVGDGRR